MASNNAVALQKLIERSKKELTEKMMMAVNPPLMTGGLWSGQQSRADIAAGPVGPAGSHAHAHHTHPGMASGWDLEVIRPSLNHMIASRLRLHEGEHIGFDHIWAHQIAADKFVVFLVIKGTPMMLEDDALFPSDKLITQLRLLRG